MFLFPLFILNSKYYFERRNLFFLEIWANQGGRPQPLGVVLIPDVVHLKTIPEK